MDPYSDDPISKEVTLQTIFVRTCKGLPSFLRRNRTHLDLPDQACANYNITDGQEDYDELTYDTMESIRFANRLLSGTLDEKQQAEDELIASVWPS